MAEMTPEEAGKLLRLNELHAEIERLRADKHVQRSQDRNAAYEGDIRQLEAEIERLRQQLWLAREDMAHLVQQIDAVLG